MNDPLAIWYVPQFKEWAIGSISKIGTNWRGISSNGQSEWDCPHLVPNENWDYYDQNDGWITAVGERVVLICSVTWAILKLIKKVRLKEYKDIVHSYVQFPNINIIPLIERKDVYFILTIFPKSFWNK